MKEELKTIAKEVIKQLPGEECTRLVDMLEAMGYKIRKDNGGKQNGQ